MSGHSKWSNIKRTKEVQDKKRASVFTKLSKDITIAVKIGESGDLQMNPILKVAVDKAKVANMPNDNIKRAIDKGLGVSTGEEIIIENTYEFYGPAGAALIVDCETDNPNRTITNLKTVANKNNLKLASAGSISWQFQEVGLIELFVTNDQYTETFSLEILELEGIIDIEISENHTLLITSQKQMLKSLIDTIKLKFAEAVEIRSAEISKVTDTMVDISGHEMELEDIHNALEEVEEVVNIWTNYII